MEKTEDMLVVVWGIYRFLNVCTYLFAPNKHGNIDLFATCFSQCFLQLPSFGRSRCIGFDGFVFLFRDLIKTFRHNLLFLSRLPKEKINGQISSDLGMKFSFGIKGSYEARLGNRWYRSA